MRPLAAMLVCAFAAPIIACGPSPEEICDETYRHLLQLIEREDQEDLRDTFISACERHYDPKRLQCIRDATTPEEAMACEAFLKRPG